MSSDKRIGVYSLLGIILLAAGLPLTLYNRCLAVEVSGVYTASFENSYSFNITVFLNQGDRLLLYISPLKQVNYSLTVKNSWESIVLNSTPLDKTLLIQVNFTELHTLLVRELPPFQYAQIRFEVIRFTNTPLYNYIFIGLPLTVAGATLSFTGFRSVKFLKGASQTAGDLSIKYLSTLILFLLSYISMALILPNFIIDVIFQNWFTIILLISLSLINIISVYKISINFASGKFRFLPLLLLSLAYLWMPLSITLLLQSQLLVFNYYEPNNILSFNLIHEFTLNYTSIYFQMILFILIPPVFYVYLSSTILQSRYFEQSAELNRKPVEENTLLSLKNSLIDSINNRDLVEFFNLLKNISLEAAAILFIIVKDYVERKIREFTYHKLISEYNELFNKKLYERKPVELILSPLGFINQSYGRFKIFQLNTEIKEVNFIVNQLSLFKAESKLSILESAAGLNELRERKIRFSGAE